MCAQQIWTQRYKNYFTCTNFSAEKHNFSTFCNQNRKKERLPFGNLSLKRGPRRNFYKLWWGKREYGENSYERRGRESY